MCARVCVHACVRACACVHLRKWNAERRIMVVLTPVYTLVVCGIMECSKSLGSSVVCDCGSGPN